MPRLVAALALALLLSGCATHVDPAARPAERPSASRVPSVASRAADVAHSMVGAPYRYGVASSAGFDCSGLVVYSFARAGRPGLPHSVGRLDALARPISLDELRRGDLLFFRLGGARKAHVGIYLGGRRFVHAPSSGKSVEVVDFDHVYWGPRIRLAGRI